MARMVRRRIRYSVTRDAPGTNGALANSLPGNAKPMALTATPFLVTRDAFGVTLTPFLGNQLRYRTGWFVTQ